MSIYTQLEFHVVLVIKAIYTKLFTYFKVAPHRALCFSVM